MNNFYYNFAKYSLIGIIGALIITGLSYDYVMMHYPELGEPICKGATVFILFVVIPASFILAVLGNDR